MKPFNVKEYYRDISKQVITRDGRNVRILCTNRKGNTPIIALVEKVCYNKPIELVVVYNINGRAEENRESNLDLFFKTEKKEGWINIYKRDSSINLCTDYRIHTTKEKAEECSKNKTYITTVKIEWEE